MEIKEYPRDFYARKLDIAILLRETGKEPETLGDYLEALNFKATIIETLAYFLGAVDVYVLAETNPQNLDIHIGTLAFLLMSFADDMHTDTEKTFREYFKMDK